MEDRSLFISSCSRRELARRRPGARMISRTQALLTLAVLLVAAGAVLAARGGL